ncbi:8-amino-7-oxononanoate synthase [Carboxylicivirga sp. M1479]|uniref:aminotransferase class I/II-fold pyridoxal phosphate-dependent enzyme n=1 Tax=Carboxylicivirga sp. M1479 TaxID=2594476 RepID=UPI001177F039|nr:8-amino-7-oxononanoate synthase [Carboxylicivirga sp. M1479]TRX64267.1 8-amino-7-oxononanoate synthase [Carboxylicivirga sp. M1479]
MIYHEQIESIIDTGLLREFKQVVPEESGRCIYEGRELLNLTSNDYLGLATNTSLKQDFMQEVMDDPKLLGFGASSSRLLTGNSDLYDDAEYLLKMNYSAEAALFFNSGYHANMGILPSISEKKDLILSDKLCHASIIDGIRLSQADHLRYRHLDYEQLMMILQKKRHLYQRVFIVSESLFSMDGDTADLARLVTIKERFNCYLYIDEAHAVGAIGENGLGVCEQQNVVSKIDLIVGTLGKAYASIGAFVILSQTLKVLLVNKARTLIYTTALPPINMAWNKFVIRQMIQFRAQRINLSKLSHHLNEELKKKVYKVHMSHIVPIMIGNNQSAVELANHLRKKGFLVFPIRPPTVPKNTARLRISLTANMHLSDLNEFVNLIPEYRTYEV